MAENVLFSLLQHLHLKVECWGTCWKHREGLFPSDLHNYLPSCLGDTAKPKLWGQCFYFYKVLWNPSLIILYAALKCWCFKGPYRCDT